MFTSWNWLTLFMYILLLCCIPPSTLCSHFLGGNVMIQPKPPDPGQNCSATEVEITSVLSWRRSIFNCDSSRLANSNITISTTNFNCQYGCQGSVSIGFFCTEFSIENDWSYSVGYKTHLFIVSDTNAVTIGTTSGAWVNPYGGWNISTTFSLIPRVDTGKINSPPRVASFPKLQLLEGHEHAIPLAVSDPDGDDIRCRWAVDVECSSVCNSIPGAILDPNSCNITYLANNGTGLKAVAIMIEDFIPSSSVPLSSVAHQFIVEVVDSSGLSCPSPPQFVTAPQGTSCIAPNTSYTETFIATSGCSNVLITSIQITAPIGMNKGELQPMLGTNNFYTSVIWMPTANQQNDTYLLCFIAVSSESLTSEQSCIKLAVGYYPPAPLPESATRFVYPSNSILQIMFDNIIQRPSMSSFIRFYTSGEMVHQIDASSSIEVDFNGANLTIVPNYVLAARNSYYINFDKGVVECVEGCRNDPILSDTFWTFEAISLIPDVSALNNLTLGQPLILQCSVTAIRDINSRVDFVWTSNGTELERVEGVTGVSSTSNLAVYTHYYIISQLSTADSNSLYTCEVIINQSPPLSSNGSFMLDIPGFTPNVSVIALNNQILGQPLILQCSVTTIRDINSRVDFVWTSNGTELERVEKVAGLLSTSNLAVYTHYYIISQLSAADNNSVYSCEVIINRIPPLSTTGIFKLNIPEATLVDALDSNDDDDDDNNSIIFIILFAISVSINLLICMITLSYCLRKIYGKGGSNHNYDVSSVRNNAETSDVHVYENFSLKNIGLPTEQQPVNPATEDDLTMERNPSYVGINCSNRRMKPAVKDVNVEEDLYDNMQ